MLKKGSVMLVRAVPRCRRMTCGFMNTQGLFSRTARARAIQKTLGHGRLALSWRAFVALSARPTRRAAPAQVLLYTR